MPLTLVVLFFVTAALYASVGFGGGSTYNALLVLYGADYRILPSVALICNIIVVAGGAVAFHRSGAINFPRLAPFLLTSVPAAWAGGRIEVSETFFVGALGASLLAAGLHLAFQFRESPGAARAAPAPLLAAIGAAIGFISGLVGVGGGVFLAPILYYLRWGTAREIAAASSVFILANSISGLAGQLMKISGDGATDLLAIYWPAFIAVLIGGQIGSRLAASILSAKTIRRLTALLILYVSARLLLRFATLAGVAGA